MHAGFRPSGHTELKAGTCYSQWACAFICSLQVLKGSLLFPEVPVASQNGLNGLTPQPADKAVTSVQSLLNKTTIPGNGTKKVLAQVTKSVLAAVTGKKGCM